MEKIINLLRKLTLIIPILTAVAILILFLSNSNRGLGMMDESYYILNAKYPTHNIANFTFFGYYTGILYHLACENLSLFRQIGTILLFCTSLLFANAIIRYLHIHLKIELSTMARLNFLAIASIGGLGYHQLWLSTPSYNWLALIATLITATGLVYAATYRQHAEPLRNFYINAALVGMGGGLSFMAKPTTALFLAFTALLWISITKIRKQWFKFNFACLCFVLLFFLGHLALSGDKPIDFIDKIILGATLENLLGNAHGLKDVFIQAYFDFSSLPNRMFLWAGDPLVLSFIALLFIIYFNRDLGCVNPYIITSISLIIWLKMMSEASWNHYYTGIITVTLLLSLMGISFFLWFIMKIQQISKKEPLFIITSTQEIAPFLSLMLLLFLLSTAFAFGSNNGLVLKMGDAIIYLVIALYSLAHFLEKNSNQKALCFVLSVIISVSISLLLYHAYQRPYNTSGSIAEQTEPVHWIDSSHTLLVSPQTKQYINALKSMAVNAGWKSHTALIDLTGNGPGACLVLNARFLGVAWLVGSFRGSEEYVRSLFSYLPKKELEAAWILTSSNGKRKISALVLQHAGLKYPLRYEKVGDVITARTQQTQSLWKPL